MHKIRIGTHGNPLPKLHGAWIDHRTAEIVTIEPFEYRMISLGVSMELPDGYYAKMAPRSSTCKNCGVIMASSIGMLRNRDCGGFGSTGRI